VGDTKVIGLVFDLPHTLWTQEVLRVRKQYDPARANFPVEITVAGSSGLGWFSPSQTIAYLAEGISAIASSFTRFTFEFFRVERFPNSRVYYFAVRDATPFHAFQHLLAGSGLQFEPIPFSYTPHCTIAELSPSADDVDHAVLRNFNVPEGTIEVSSVSFYAVNSSRNQCEHLGRIALGR
jgi:2'-5' RNA ligase